MFAALRLRRARMLISLAKDEWLQSIEYLSTNTQKEYKRVINDFTLNLSKKYIQSVSSVDVRHYLNQFAWHHKNTTVNKHLMGIKSFYRFLDEVHNITNVTLGLRKRKEKMPYRPFISKKDLDLILSSATQKEKDIIRMLANTGMRCSELCGMRPDNISPNLSSITIQGKGGKIRTIPCNQTVREILSRSINFSMNRKTIYTISRQAGMKSGFRLSPHMLRRFFCTSLLNAGVSLLIISRLLGHSSVRTTEIYLQLDSSFLSGVTDCLD